MDKNELQAFVEQGLSHRQIASKKECSQSNVKYWLNKFGLQSKNKFGRGKTINQCKFCGADTPRRKICRGCACTLKRYINKIRAVKYKGGKCSICGWQGNNEQIAGFEFHHTDGNKDFQVSNFWHYGWNKVKPELDKCEMVCSICHRILHNKLINSAIAKEAARLADLAISAQIDKKEEVEPKSRLRCISCQRYFVQISSSHQKYCSLECARLNNRKVKNRPNKQELEKLIKNNSWCALGRKFGVSDNAVRKWAKQYGIEWEIRKY